MARKEMIQELIAEIELLERAFFDGLTDEQRSQEGSLERWSARDLWAHIAAWKERLADNIQRAKNGQPPQWVSDFDQANAELFEQHRAMNWQQVANYAGRAARKLSQQVESLSEIELDSLDFMPYANNRPVWRTVASYGYSHPMIHLAEHYREKDELMRAGELIGRMSRSMAGLDNSTEWQGVTRYNLACQYALLGEADKAIDELREALALNPGLVEWSKNDTDLEPIRAMDAYRAIYESLPAGE